jgi:hypothetical protein
MPRQEMGLPRMKLNIELKGGGTGNFVQNAINAFNGSKGVNAQIRQDEIFYISFLDRELAVVVGLIRVDGVLPVPNANLILGVPTKMQYKKVGEHYSIEDFTLNTEELKPVDELHSALQSLGGRHGKGLNGVDMSLWDVSDSSIEYFCKQRQIPIHIAIVPFEEHDLKGREISRALNNVNKVAVA